MNGHVYDLCIWLFERLGDLCVDVDVDESVGKNDAFDASIVIRGLT